MGPLVSVIICTHNRVKDLGAAIESVLSQGVDETFYEMLVVDNASTDSTHDYVRARAAQVSNLKYMAERVLGLSRARNTGLRAARGQYVAYLDDDAVADPGWLLQIPVAFAAGGADIGCVAGKIDPIWGAPRPPWLHDHLLGCISVLDYSPVATRLEDHQEPFGANVIYRREALLRVGGFSTALGRKGGRLLSNEEILLQRQLRRLGYATYYDPHISVRHHIPASRLTKSWFKRRAYWQGVSNALLESHLDSTPSLKVVLKRLRTLASIAKRPRELLSLARRGNDPIVFFTAVTVLTKLGYATASVHSAKQSVG
jgi:glucosyl-dolichyl phosphate glucuronosyltransferase